MEKLDDEIKTETKKLKELIEAKLVNYIKRSVEKIRIAEHSDTRDED